MSCGSNSSLMGIGSIMGIGDRCPTSSGGTHALSSPCSSGLLTPTARQQQHPQHQHQHFTRARRSPCNREDGSGGGGGGISPLSRTGGAGMRISVARRSLSRSPSCRSGRWSEENWWCGAVAAIGRALSGFACVFVFIPCVFDLYGP